MTREEYIANVSAQLPRLRRYMAALCCGNLIQADDIVQDALLKAYLAIDTFRSQDKFLSWLYRIGYNTFLNTLRTQHEQTGYEEACTLTADSAADENFRYEALYNALRKISPAERSSILLYYIQDYSVKEIAKIEEISEEAVRQHLSRGRKHLREVLRDRY